MVHNEKPEDFLKRYPHQLSGGQRQRVALLQALMHDPFVLFADEPTGNLDGATREEIMQVLDTWLQEKPFQRLMIWVTHHEDDPQLVGVDKRLYVDGGTCRWQEYGQDDSEIGEEKWRDLHV